MCIATVRKIAIVAVALIVSMPSARANVLDKTDADRITSLMRNATQLQEDVLNIAKGTANLDAKDCLLNLHDAVTMWPELQMLEMLVSLSTLMIDRSDEQTVLHWLRLKGAILPKLVDSERGVINRLSGMCAWTNVVPMKAREILAFHGRALSVVTSILARIDAHSERQSGGNGDRKRNEAKITTGTGFAVSDRDIVTNEHVVKGCSYVTVRQGPVEFYGSVVANDQTADLAIVRLGLPNVPSNLIRDKETWERLSSQRASFGTLRQSPPLKAGEQAISYGFPLSGALATEGNLTVGNVSALHGLGDDPKEIQITTPVQAGNSGGPLLDRSGNIIGVTAAKLNAIKVLGDVGDLPQNVNFAINLTTLKTFLSKNKISVTEAPSRDDLNPAEIGDLFD
jgi:S1-C subfamily serine protease